MNDYHLTKHFKLSEFLHNNHNFLVVPHRRDIFNLKHICVETLQPLRDEVSVPIYITSGLRSIGLNAVVGGKPDSQHLTGNAVDFRLEDPFKMDQAFYWIIRYLPFDQLIYYNNDLIKKRFIHLSLVDKKNRKDIMIYECGRHYHLDYWLKTAFSL